MPQIALDFLICIPATVFFALMNRVPRRAVLPAALVGALGYAAFEAAGLAVGSSIARYFFGTLLMAVLSEILARVLRMPATVFIIPAIIPLVPGLGLYQTMNELVQGHDAQAAQVGVSTLLSIVGMAMAMVLTTLCTSLLSSRRKSRPRS